MKTLCLLFLISVTFINDIISQNYSIPFAESDIILDGILNEEIWKTSLKFDTMYQVLPNTGKTSDRRTEVYMFYTSECLFFGIQAFEPEKRTSISRRRDTWSSSEDFISIYLDSYNDNQNAYFFGVNLYNNQFDGILTTESATSLTWDANWFSAVNDTSNNYYSIEIKIPFERLKFKKETWGINILRNTHSIQEISSITNIGFDYYQVSRFIKISGLDKMDLKHKINIMPSFVVLNKINNQYSSKQNINLSLDLNYAYKGKIDIASTINPDYAEVEPDMDYINFQKESEKYFPEKRYFFNEGFQLFQDNEFYSRRIQDIEYGFKSYGKFSNAQYNVFYIKSTDTTCYQAFSGHYQFLKQSYISLTTINMNKPDNKFDRVYGFNSKIGISDKIYFLSSIKRNSKSGVKNDSNIIQDYMLNYSSRNILFSAAYFDYGKFYKPEFAYVGIRGFKGPQITMLTKQWPKNIFIYRSYQMVQYSSYITPDNRKKFQGWQGSFYATIINKKIGLNFDADLTTRLYNRRERQNKQYTQTIYFNPEEKKFRVAVSYGWGLYYMWHLNYWSFSFQRKLTEKIFINVSYENEQLKQKDIGSFNENNIIFSLKTTWQFNKKLSARIFISPTYNKIDNYKPDRYIYTNVLLRYDISNISRIFFVWNEERQSKKDILNLSRPDDSQLENRAFYFKLAMDITELKWKNVKDIF